VVKDKLYTFANKFYTR